MLHPHHAPPEKPAELTWRDYLIMLLHTAAELEHSLMVQYLYAAYSLDDKSPGPHRAKVAQWRATILGVAKEEMGHLLTVQNLICLMGGPISFERENYPWDSPYYPFKFCLEPLTRTSLAKYVFAEMPPKETAARAAHERTAQAAMKLLKIKSGHPVGEVYDLIIALVESKRIADSDFHPDSYGVQASFDEWGRNYRPGPLPPLAKSTDPQPRERDTRLIVARMATRTEALAALRDVAGQGEAPEHKTGTDEEPSHFERFAHIFRELTEIQKKDPNWSPALQVPTNPVVEDPNYVVKGTTNITATASRTWASLFNVRYRMLLTYLTHTYRIARPAAGKEDGVFAAVLVGIFGEMYNLKTLAGMLARVPLRNGKNDPRRAGATFELPYTLVLPETDVNCWEQHRDLVACSIGLIDELLKTGNLDDAPPEGKAYLTALRQLDGQSTVFIDQVLMGLRPVRRGRK